MFYLILDFDYLWLLGYTKVKKKGKKDDRDEKGSIENAQEICKMIENDKLKATWSVRKTEGKRW